MEEKKYKEALERAKSAIKECGDNIGRIKMIESIFPELKESEDERIRKELVEWLKSKLANPSIGFNPAKMEKWIAWLEKVKDFDKKLEEAFKNSDEVQYKRGYDNGYVEGIAFAKQELEKQGEQKPIIEMKSPEESLGISSKEYNEIVNACLYGEPKHTEFKVGDWVVYNNQNASSPICQINKVDGDIIDLIGLQGERFQTESWDLNKNYHPWSISDAKDGDVLANGKMIVIFKHLEEPSYRQHIVAYIGLDNSGHIQVTDGHWELGIDKVKPATKEQCDTLEKAMTNAGYRWNKEELKLEKI